MKVLSYAAQTATSKLAPFSFEQRKLTETDVLINKGKIVQFAYGDDGFEPTRTENQIIPLTGMSLEDIYMHYDILGLNDHDKDLLNVYTKGTITRLKKQRMDIATKL